MKTLKFKPHLADMIRTGKKVSTWRLFDDKDLQEGVNDPFFQTQEYELLRAVFSTTRS